MGWVLTKNHMRRITAHAERERPLECCGVLLGEETAAGRIVVRSVVAAENVAEGDRRRRYAIDPRELLEAHREARRGPPEGPRQVIGSYHSHPADTPIPSVEDARHAWPDTVYLIVGREGGRWRARCWRWHARQGFVETGLEIVDGAGHELAES